MAISKEQLIIQLKAEGITATKAQINNLHKTVNKTEKGFGGMAATIATATVAIFAAQRAIGSIISTGKEFEQSMANVKAISGASGREFDMLAKSAKNLGATTVFTASQVAELQTEFAKLGFTATEITGVTEGTLALSSAVGSDLATSAAVAGSTLRGFGLDVSETTRVTDVMALSFSSSALDMDKFANSMTYVAPIAKSAGVDIEGTTAILGQLANAGIAGSMAGTSLRRILLEAGNASSKLAKRMGGPITSFEDFQSKLKKLKDDGFDPIVDGADLVGKRSVSAFEIMLNGVDAVDALGESFNSAGGAAQKMAEVQLDTLEGKLKLATSAMDGLKIEIFEANEGAIKQAVEGFTAFIESLDAETVNSYAAGIGVAATALGIYSAATLLAALRSMTLAAALAKTPWGVAAVAISLVAGKLIHMSGALEVAETEQEKQAEAALKAAKAAEAQAKAVADLNKELDKQTLKETTDQLDNVLGNLGFVTAGYAAFKQELLDLETAYNTNKVPEEEAITTRNRIASLKEILPMYEAEMDQLEQNATAMQNYINSANAASAVDGGEPGTGGGSAVKPPTDAEIEAAQTKLQEFHLSEIESIEEQNNIKLLLEETRLKNAAKITGAGEETLTKITDSFKKKRQANRDKFDKMEQMAQLKHHSMLLGGLSSFIGQFAGGEKIAARIQQTKAVIDTYSAANKAYTNAGGFPTGIIPAAASIAYGLGNVMRISKSIGDFKTAATGMDDVVTRPTMILAGEAGAEQVSITPLDGPNIDGPQGSQPVNITFTGNVMSQDFIENEAIPMIAEAVRRGATLGDA